MARILSLCLEDLGDGAAAARFVQCTALPHRGPGLSLDGEGKPGWQLAAGVAAQLCASGDGKLILLRCPEAPACVVQRAGRSLDAPAGKPVVLLDRDRVVVGGHPLRIHLHGPTDSACAPTPVSARRPGKLLRAAAAAFAVGATVGGGSAGAGQPSALASGGPPAGAAATAADLGLPGAEVGDGGLDAGDAAADGAIEVREFPPAPPPPPPLGGCCARRDPDAELARRDDDDRR
jgi:hypothetical protein